MDIVSRIKLFLKLNGIANSIFADTCEIPRPTVSQLLNGRNKKVSNEVIDKIHAAYPDLSMMWLMFGEDPMMVNGQNQTSLNLQGTDEVHENSKKTDGSELGLNNFVEQNNVENMFQPTSQAVGVEPRNSVSEVIESLAKNLGKKSVGMNTNNKDERRIVNIMVFYSDNSFESFVPNK